MQVGYPKQVYDSVWQILGERRRQSRDGLATRREEIARTLPGVAALEREMAAQAASVTKIIVSDPAAAGARIEELAQANLATQREREALLAGAGYPADYLTERHVCDLCRDSGYVGQTMCRCMAGLLRAEAAARLSRYAPTGSATFGSFSLEYYPDTADGGGIPPRAWMADILDDCRRWAEPFAPHGESLLLVGPTGLGKTHLSVAMAAQVTQQGYGVLYTPVQRMMDILEAERFSRGADAKEQYRDATAAYLDCDLLILDDLGAEFMTQFVSATLFHILNTRLLEERPTVISTNLGLEDMGARYSQRMSSRLFCGYRVMLFKGDDIRFRKRMTG